MPNNLRQIRAARGLTQEVAAAAIDTTRSQYVKLEHGTRRLHLGWIERVADAFCIDPGDVVTARAIGGER